MTYIWLVWYIICIYFLFSFSLSLLYMCVLRYFIKYVFICIFSLYMCVFMYLFIMYFTFTLSFVCVAARKFYIYNTYMTYFSLSLSQMYVCVCFSGDTLKKYYIYLSCISLSQMYVCVFQRRHFTEKNTYICLVFHFHFLKCMSVCFSRDSLQK